MFKFGVRNLRRLRQVDSIELRPLTILVGRNSSGKSSFLRTLPLLRQSLQTRTSSPILWYGDFVDFGSFDGVVSDNDDSKDIAFSFGLDRVQVRRGRHFPTYHHFSNLTFENVDLTVEIGNASGKTYLKSFEISYGANKNTYNATLNEDGSLRSLRLNGSTITQHYDGYSINFSLGSIFPYLTVSAVKDEDDNALFGFRPEPMLKATTKLIAPFLDKRTQEGQIDKLALEILSMPSWTEKNLNLVEQRPGQRTFRKLIEDVRTKNSKKLRDKLKEIHTASLFEPLLTASFEALREFLSMTLYIGPVRARSERYYRYQELAVSEIDPDGKNFPMFLNSLTERQRAEFSQWVQDRFGYGVVLSQPAGHISINLIVGDKITNIVDNGYGISQVLPVLGQIWWAANRPRSRSPLNYNTAPILAIEQPELHLHPAHQALLADAFAAQQGRTGSPGSSRRALQFVIETHSEALVNRIGTLISERQISETDVQILIFENEDEGERVTNVRQAFFDEEGVLQNWPYGFFQPELA